MKAQLEPIAPSRASSLHCRRVAESRFQHPLHYHPEIEITYIVRSKGTRMIGDHIGTFSEGDLCLIGENLPHIYTNTLPPVDGAEAEVLQFRRDFSNGFIDATPDLLPFSRLLDSASQGIVFDQDTAREAWPLLKAIRLGQSLDRVKYFIELIVCLISAREASSLASPGYIGTTTAANSNRMHFACVYILQHFREKIDHEGLAAKVHLAPASFSRLFKRVTRKTCTDFINEVRLGHACRLLMETNDPVTEIAFECGFSNISNFNRRFKQHYNCSPRQYRGEFHRSASSK